MPIQTTAYVPARTAANTACCAGSDGMSLSTPPRRRSNCSTSACSDAAASAKEPNRGFPANTCSMRFTGTCAPADIGLPNAPPVQPPPFTSSAPPLQPPPRGAVGVCAGAGEPAGGPSAEPPLPASDLASPRPPPRSSTSAPRIALVAHSSGSSAPPVCPTNTSSARGSSPSLDASCQARGRRVRGLLLHAQPLHFSSNVACACPRARPLRFSRNAARTGYPPAQHVRFLRR